MADDGEQQAARSSGSGAGANLISPESKIFQNLHVLEPPAGGKNLSKICWPDQDLQHQNLHEINQNTYLRQVGDLLFPAHE
jgi:hypothetical protein